MKSRSRAIPVPVLTSQHDCWSRFWYKIEKGEPHECWHWKGGATTRGYGRFKVGDRLFLAHRLYAIANGQIPRGRGYHGTEVMHSCDNPRCCNPAHLVLGTNRDNARYMVAKGRAPFQNRTPSAPHHSGGHARG